MVADEVRQALTGASGVEFLEVEFARSFSLPYEPDDDPYPEEDEEEVVQRFVDELPSSPVLTPYWELIVSRLAPGRSLSDAVSFEVATQWSAVPLEVRLSLSEVDSLPLFWDRQLFMRDDVFEKVKPFFDERYFEVRRLRFDFG